MSECEILVIGGGVAAYNAAKRVRREQPLASLIMVSADSLAPYDLPPISKEFLRGEKSETDILFPDLLALGGPTQILLSSEVVALNPADRNATLAAGSQIGFSKALIATGAKPIPLPIPGAALPGVFYVRTADDARRIATAAKSARRTVVIGAGFIGLEVAASLRYLGVDVTVIEAQDRIWPRFADPAVAEVVQARCVQNGVKLILSQRVVAIEGEGAVRSVTTSSGEQIACDLICVGIGVTPDTALAEAAGLEISDGIVVDAHMQTSAPGIYAAGDVVNYPDAIVERRLRAEHWCHAEYSGQVAGSNMAGRVMAYDFMSYAWSDVFDLHIEASGYPEGHDEVVVRSALDGSGFTSLYLKKGRMIGYCAVNAQPVEFATYRRMIRSRQLLSTHIASLRDANVNVRGLIQA